MKKFYLFFITLLAQIMLLGCTKNTNVNIDNTALGNVEAEKIIEADISEEKEALKLIDKVELEYATEFSIDLYESGYASIHVTDGNSYVLVPKGHEEIILDDANATFIHMPCDSIYLAATSAMDLFRELDSLDYIKSCSTKAEDYDNNEVKNLIDANEISYVGKYSAPDYEKLVALNTSLAIESTMIYHSPKIKEELNGLGIPVLVERSSYEKEPLGRLEWIKLYGLLLGKSDLANEIFDKQVTNVNTVINGLQNETKSNSKKPKVVFFYLSSNGYVNVRKPGDYVSKMIEIAGGEYALESLKIEEENALSTVNISWEDFYYYGKDADILIYNGTIDGGIESVNDLINANEMFLEFKAIKDGRAYCMGSNMHQESSKVGEIIVELYSVINKSGEGLNYIKKVN